MAKSRRQISQPERGSSFLAPPQWTFTAVGIIAAIFMLGLFVPWQPSREGSSGYFNYFDFSWMLMLNDALATGKQFGKQIILPYGPMGFVTTSVYDPRTYLILVVAKIAIAGTVFAGMWKAARAVLPHPLLILASMIAVAILMGRSPDHFFGVCAILLLLNYFAIEDRRMSPVAWALVVVEAVASLAKVNMLMQAMVVVGAISIDQIVRRRWRGVALPGMFAGCMLLFYLLARQSLGSLGAFIWGWEQVSAGHVDAVSMPGVDLDAQMYVGVVVLMVIAIADYEWRKRRLGAILPVGALTLLFLLLYKHSFVRQDFAHATIGPLVVMATMVLYAPILWRTATNGIRRWMCIGLLLVAGSVASTSLSEYLVPGEFQTPDNAPPEDNLWYYAWSQTKEAASQLAALGADVIEPSRLRQQWESARAKTREEMPVPVAEVKGTVDIYPHRQDVLFAYGLDYQPRPASQSLIATAPSLARANVEHLLGPTAPDSILFTIDPVDNAYPSFNDGLSWPDLLTRYDIVDASGAFLVLRRSPVPREWRLTPFATIAGKMDEYIPIADVGEGPIWAKFRLKRKLAGRIWAAIHKWPPVGIHVRTGVPAADDDSESFRYLPSLAEEGFLLSPLIQTRKDFARLESKTWQKDLSLAGVRSLKITMGDVPYDKWFEPDFTIELERLDFPHQDLSGIPRIHERPE